MSALRILEALRPIDEELGDMRSCIGGGLYRTSDELADQRPFWQQRGWSSAEQMEDAVVEAGETRYVNMLLARGALGNELRLEQHMWRAIQKGDTATIKYLLDQGTNPNMLGSRGGIRALATACELGQLECAKLLREYGAYLTCDTYDDEEPWSKPSPELVDLLEPDDTHILQSSPPRNDMADLLENTFQLLVNNPMFKEGYAAKRAAEEAAEEAARAARAAWEEVMPPVREWILSSPLRGSKGPEWSCPPYPVLRESCEEWFPAPPGVKWFVVRDVLCWHRGLRDQNLPLRRWARVRNLVKKRGIALYWQERTQERLCAEGGEGRKRDREDYEEC